MAGDCGVDEGYFLQARLDGEAEAIDQGDGDGPRAGPAKGALGFGPDIRHSRDGLEIAQHADHPEESAARGAREFVVGLGLR